MAPRMDEARELRVRGRTVWKVGLHVALVVALLHVLSQVTTVLGWAVLATTLALALDPVVVWLERRGFRRGVAVVAVFVVLLGLLVTFVATFVPMLVEQARAFVERAPEMLERLRTSRVFRAADAEYDVVERLRAELTGHASAAAAYAVGALGTVLSAIVGTVTVAVLTAFMLAFGRPLLRSSLAWLEPARRAHAVVLAEQVRDAVGGYVLGSMVVAGIGGAVTAVTLLALGVPYFLPLGLLMALLGLVPFLGPVIGGALVVGTTFLAAGATDGLVALAVFVGYQQLENQILSPMVQRKTIHMNPLLVVAAMLVGTSFAGILGAVLALPLAATTKVFLDDALARRARSWGEGADARGGSDDREAAARARSAEASTSELAGGGA